MAYASIRLSKLRPRLTEALGRAQGERERLRRVDQVLEEYWVLKRNRSFWERLSGRGEPPLPDSIRDLVGDHGYEVSVQHHFAKKGVRDDIKMLRRLESLCTLASQTDDGGPTGSAGSTGTAGSPTDQTVWIDEAEAEVIQKWWML